MHHHRPHEHVAVDDDLAERLRVIVDALGGGHLPLRCIVRHLLAEAAAQLEAQQARKLYPAP